MREREGGASRPFGFIEPIAVSRAEALSDRIRRDLMR